MAPPPAPPPPPPPPPPIEGAFVDSNQSLAQEGGASNLSQPPVTSQQPAQNESSFSSGEKVWERPWSFDEMRTNSSNWTLAADAGLLLYLQQFSQRMISQTHEIEKQVDGLVNNTKGIDTKVKNTVNDFLMLSNLQFIENRVYDDHEEEAKDTEDKGQEQSPEMPKEKSREQREAEVIPRISEALKHGISVLDEAFITLDLVAGQEEESEDEDNDVKIDYKSQVILEPKDVYANRSLPHLIGTVEFFKDDLVGLAESSGEESEGEEDVSETESESEEEEEKSSVSGSETSESYSESESEFSSSEEEKTKEKKSSRKEVKEESSSDEDLFREKKPKEEGDSSDEEEKTYKEEEKEERQKKTVNAPLDFASELAAKLGGKIPVKQESDEGEHDEDGWSDDNQQVPQPVKEERSRTETSKSHSDSKTKEKKGHSHHHGKHHHHGDKSKDSHGHRRKRHDSRTSKVSVESSSRKDEDDLFAPQSTEDDGLFGDAERPFTKKGGLFSSGGGLFDDNEQDDLFAEEKKESSEKKTQDKTTVEEDDDEDLQIKPRSRSTASGKKIPAGAVSIFGESGLFGSPTKETVVEASPPRASVKKSSGGGLFDDGEEESDLFSNTASDKKQSGQEKTKPQKKETKKVDLFGGEDEDNDEGDLFSGNSVASVQPEQKKKKLPAGAVPIFGSSPPPLFGSPSSEKTEEAITHEVKKEPKSAPPVPQLSKSKPGGGGGGLFSDDSEEGGSLFGSPPKPKPESDTRTKSKPKATISLFDDDEQDEEEDFFVAPPAKSKSVQAEKKPQTGKQEKIQKPSKPSGLFDEDETVPEVAAPVAAQPPDITKGVNKTKPKSSSKIQSMFDDEDDGMFGSESDDLFSSKPKKPQEENKEKETKPSTKKPTTSLFSDNEDDLFSDKPNEQSSEAPPNNEEGLFSVKPKAKPSAASTPSKTKPSKGLFSDEEDDLFGGTAKPSEKASVTETEPVPPQVTLPETEPVAEDAKPIPKKPPAGAVSMFGGADLFGGGGVSLPKPKGVKKMADPLGGGGLFGEEEDEDLFAAKPKATAKPVEKKPETDPDAEDAKPKPKKPPPGAVSMFGGADLFGGKGVSPPKPKGVKKMVDQHGEGGLFGEEDEGDLFASKPKPLVKPTKTKQETVTADHEQQKPEVQENSRVKKPVGAVSMFGDVDMFKGKGVSPPKPSVPVKPAANKKELLSGEEEQNKSASAALPVPKPSTLPRATSGSPGSNVAKLQKSLAFNVTSLLPGATPPSRQPVPVVASFDEPAEVKTLQAASKGRAKIQVKRRPPTRRAMQVAATQSASDESLFGSTLTAKEDRVDTRPLSFPAASNPLTGQDDIGPVRTESAASDMSDDFFGFTSTKASKPKPNEEIVSSSPKLPESISEDLFSTPKPSKQTLYGDDIPKREVTSSKSKASSEESQTFSSMGDDLFAVPSLKDETKSKDTETNAKIVSEDQRNDLFAASTGKDESETKDAKASKNVVPPLEDDDLFATSFEKNKTKAKDATLISDDDLFSISKTDSLSATGEKKSNKVKDVSPVLEKNGKTILTETTSGEAIPNPLLQDDNKSVLDHDASVIGATTAQKSGNEDAKKIPASKSKSVYDDDDELFSVSKSSDTRRRRKVVKPLGDDDLFGDSGNIFDDLPTKPKEKKKKKATQPKKDIFDDASGKAEGEKSAKKTKTKKKLEKKPAKSIFDDDTPSIFDDPLNATGQ